MAPIPETSVADFAHPEVPGLVASFLFSPDPERNPGADDNKLQFLLRTRVDRELEEGDFLCRGYPLDADGREMTGLKCSWGRSPNFDATFTYLPALSGRQFVELTSFDTDQPVGGLLLVVQAWRESISPSDLTVDACALRRRGRQAGRRSLTYTLVPPPADA
jgi:hypothetical protein